MTARDIEENDDSTSPLKLRTYGTSTTTESGESDRLSQPTEGEASGDGKMLGIAFIAMLVFQLGNRIFGRLQTYPMYNYPLFLNLMMVGVYIPICFAYIWPMMWFTGDRVITAEQLAIPKYKFAVMGGYDSLAGIMQTFAVNYIANASMIVLVQQSAIPISMVISRWTLGAEYTRPQYIGAAIVLMGIVAVVIPSLSASTDTADAGLDGSSGGIGAASEANQMLWLSVLVVSCVPMCLSSVYKEKALGEMEIDVVYLNGWVAIYQFLIAIPLCFPTSAVQNIAMSSIWPNMVGGMRCWMGINTITEDFNPDGLPLDDCSTAPLYVTTYLFFNVIYNFLVIVILKLGSANILWMASTVIVPLSNVAFSMDFMPGHQPLKQADLVGLVIIMLGLVIYRFYDELMDTIKRSLRLVGLNVVGEDTKDDLSSTEDAARRRKAEIARNTQRKQYRYMGLNQTEHLQSLVETRIAQAQSASFKLQRSPNQIRGTFLARIGVQPSPLLRGSGGRRLELDRDALSHAQATGYSPHLKSYQRTNSFRSPSVSRTPTATTALLSGHKPNPSSRRPAEV